MPNVVQRPRLSYMIRDLQKIKDEYNSFVTVQTIHDDFGSQKRQLTELVDRIREVSSVSLSSLFFIELCDRRI